MCLFCVTCSIMRTTSFSAAAAFSSPTRVANSERLRVTNVFVRRFTLVLSCECKTCKWGNVQTQGSTKFTRLLDKPDSLVPYSDPPRKPPSTAGPRSTRLIEKL